MYATETKSAESDFRAAFERLKKNKPNVLPKNSLVTQNNVAREAGKDPSALRKTRYPLLILEIQSFINARDEHLIATQKSKDNRSLTNREKLTNYRKQLNRLSSIVHAQDAVIEVLLEEIRKTTPNYKINF